MKELEAKTGKKVVTAINAKVGLKTPDKKLDTKKKKK
jgi:tRNA(Ser,Leu) C12 N-acetylase TAN1